MQVYAPPAPAPALLRATDAATTPLICFSHLRWDFVVQRPQHLMNRFAKSHRVFVFEEPVFDGSLEAAELQRRDTPSGVTVLTPRLREPLAGDTLHDVLRTLLDQFIAGDRILDPVLWYYTPMMRAFSAHVEASAVVYDCMDELANFRFAPAGLHAAEDRLLRDADVVFTGGYSLYEAKQTRHANIHPFPSSVDVAHFARARQAQSLPADLAAIPSPRLGYYGVIDERIDLDLIAATADARPEWQIVMVGPLAKVDPAHLPQRPNIHYLGNKSYDELPAYLAGWDVALMPFALNESTRFISPTKTPEYLAGGKPVVSTRIADVVLQYGELAAVSIADTPAEFVAACAAAIELSRDVTGWRDAVDAVLADLSWERTQASMKGLVQVAARRRSERAAPALVRAGKIVRGYDDVIVGAGFAGSVLAERLARGAGRRVLLIDRRPHLGGNAYDCTDATGVMVHQYGPHIFHTNSQRILHYLSRFTRWRPYEHRVLASVDGKLLPMPINRTTLNGLYGLDLKTDLETERFLREQAQPVSEIRTAEDVVLSSVGPDLYRRFFRGYTRKQWGVDPSLLDKAVTARVPARNNTDDRYFTDRYQVMPRDGYTRMFENMTDHPNITVQLGVDFADVKHEVGRARLFYSGPIDQYFDYRHGPLPYRSLRFEHRTLDQAELQPVAVVNYPDESVPYTRITEYKHLTGQVHAKTSVTYEYPCDDGDPYYPVPRPENQALYRRYETLAAHTPNVHFVGRLGSYRYYNMDQVVGQVLATFDRLTNVPHGAPVGVAATTARSA